MWYRHRRGWGWGGLPIPLFFVLFFVFGHSILSFLVSMVIIGFLFVLIRAVVTSTSQPGITGIPPSQQQYQPPYQPYQPYQQPYQPYQPQSSTVYDEQPYDPYQQGYRPQQSQPQETEDRYSSERPAYQQYEQPEVEYPEEELPPMQQ